MLSRFNLFRLIQTLLILAVVWMATPVAQASPAAQGFGYLTNCTGEYFNNTTATGTPVMVRTDAALNFFWPENASPGPGVNVNNYSVRWTCSINVGATANYTFNIVTDDGMNVILDGNPIIWAWYDQGPTAYTATANISAGWHTVKVEYYNRWNAGTAQVSSNLTPMPGPLPTPVPVPANTYWRGEYYNNQTLSGSPTIVRNDANLMFNWGLGSPDPSIPVDHFSARWTRTVYFNAGTWRFSATADDGVRVWVDGYLIIDKWMDQPATLYSVDVVLAAGNHNIQMEYYDNTLYAVAQLTFVPSGSVPPPPPPPTSEVIVDDLGPGWRAGGTGTWRAAPIGIGNHSFWTLNNTYTAYGYNWARWYPALYAPGYYEVFAFIPDSLGTTLNARYWIYHGGRYDLAPRAQGFYPNQWISLGTYYFNAAGGEYVSLADVTYECYLCRSIAFDAVKFVPR